MTKVKMWQLLFLEICFIFTLSFPPKQHTSSAAQPPTNAILVLVLFSLALLSPLTYFFLHLMLAYRALRDLFFPFFSECSVLSVSTFLRSTDLLCTILYKGRSGSLVSQTASISIFSPSAYLKVWFGSKEMMHLLSVVPIYFILLYFFTVCLRCDTIFIHMHNHLYHFCQFRKGLPNKFYSWSLNIFFYFAFFQLCTHSTMHYSSANIEWFLHVVHCVCYVR